MSRAAVTKSKDLAERSMAAKTNGMLHTAPCWRELTKGWGEDLRTGKAEKIIRKNSVKNENRAIASEKKNKSRSRSSSGAP